MNHESKEINCPTCGKPMHHFAYTEDSPFGTQIVEYGDVCNACKTEIFWSYGTNFYKWKGEEITQKEWSKRWVESRDKQNDK